MYTLTMIREDGLVVYQETNLPVHQLLTIVVQVRQVYHDQHVRALYTKL